MAGVGVGDGVSKIWPTPTPTQSRWSHPAAEDDFRRTVMHAPKKIERQEGKDSGCVYMKFKHHLCSDRIPSDKWQQR